jgi:hypothetical protein
MGGWVSTRSATSKCILSDEGAVAATNFNTENRTYRQLVGNGLTYRVPRFQRDYAWGDEEWEDLWTDLVGSLAVGGEPAHYMGYLVLQTTDNRTFDVIDGQQRLTTLSLVVLAAMRLLKRAGTDADTVASNQRRLDQLRATYIGYLDPVTLTSRNKLSLNRHNDGYYADYLVPLSEHLPQRGFPPSTHAMRKGFEWFERKLREHLKAVGGDPGRAIAHFVEAMSDRLFFTVITVSDELNAYKVFETLNARGVRLSATDLLKNYLFSVLARHEERSAELEDLDRRWEALVGRLGSESLPDFLRMHWNSRHSFARQSELFKTIRPMVKEREDVFALLRDMDEDIDTWLALTQPEGSSWPEPWKACARELRMFSVRQPLPLLMAAWRRLSERDFGRLLRAAVVISFRYNVIGGQTTGEQERLYHEAAARLHAGRDTTFQHVLEVLRPLYPADDKFRGDFAGKSIRTTESRNRRIVRYILCALERRVHQVELDADAPLYTLEHVLPESPGAGWEVFPERDTETFVYRLANMVLLEAGRNRDIGNAPYAEKRPVLSASTVAGTRAFAASHDDWTPETLARLQRAMAKQATAVWRIDALG